ncbi:hypothetical protein ACSR9H_10055 [Citrobacter koseri]|uniref:hypothetical protein n=1 Tax=Citrobacter koseri TaxID=545 RepID=UPI0040422563
MKHEQSLADVFNKFMEKQSKIFGYDFHSFSLDGQDRDAGADYLLSDSNRFAIIEFKFSEDELPSENKKPRRLNLCKKLPLYPTMTIYHDKCHFITFSDSTTGVIYTNVYRKQICNKSIFGDSCGLNDQSPNISSLCTANVFANSFFNGQGSHSLSFKEFVDYLAWLLNDTSGSSSSTLEVLVINPDSKDLAVTTMSSIELLHNFIKDNIKPSTQEATPKKRGPRPK